MRASLMRSAPESSCSPAAQTSSTSDTRTCSATARSRALFMSGSAWRIGDHRREVRLGGKLAVDARSAGELAHARALLHELDLKLEQHARLDRGAELRPFDGHEVNELARAGEAERFDGEDSGGLGERLDDQHSGHDRPRGEMALEEGLVDRHRLDRDDALVRVEALDPVDEEHRVAMRQRRHHPLDVERVGGGASRLVVHEAPSGPAAAAAPEPWWRWSAK